MDLLAGGGGGGGERELSPDTCDSVIVTVTRVPNYCQLSEYNVRYFHHYFSNLDV